MQVSNRTAGDSTSQPSGSSIDSIPAFGPAGQIYVIWEEYGTSGVSKIMFDVSTDGGLTWGVGGHDDAVYFPNLGDDEVDDLTAADQQKLADLAALMVADPSLVLTIEGHADTVDTPGVNQPLSERRAAAVFNYLRIHGVAESRMTQVAYGESQLAVPTADSTPELFNRRGERTRDRRV